MHVVAMKSPSCIMETGGSGNMTTFDSSGAITLPPARVMRDDEKQALKGWDAEIYHGTTKTIWIVKCGRYRGIGFTKQDAEEDYVRNMGLSG